MQPRPETELKLSRKLINYKEGVCHVIENIRLSSLPYYRKLTLVLIKVFEINAT